MSSASLAARRLALAVLYFVPGLAIASWVTRTPAIRDALHASTAEMGLVLFGISVGSMAGILSSGALVMRFGTRPVVSVGTIAAVFGMPLMGAAAAIGSAPLAAVALGVLGAGCGAAEVAMNVEGAEVERLGGRSFLPVLHGCFSLGTVVGAAAGIGFAAADFPVLWHMLIVFAVGMAAVIPALRPIPAGLGKEPRRDRSQPREPRPQGWRDPRLLLIGVVILAMAFAEGSANDWLPLIMVDEYGLDEAWGSTVFALFALAMTIGRFSGGVLVDRFGRPPVLAVSALSAVVGIALISFGQGQALALAAVVLWGLGASLGFPVALSAAGASGPHPTARVSLAATAGYLAFLVGPPLLGFIGEEVGLRGAILVSLGLAAVAVVAAAGIEPRRGRTPAPDALAASDPS